MIRTASIIWFLLVLIPVAKSNSGILLETVNKDQMSADPGQVVTVVLRIENETDENLWVEPQWTLPSGWQTVTDDQSYDLPAKKSVLKLFSIHIPNGTPAGEYDVRYIAIDTTGPEVLGAISALVEVKEVDNLSLTGLNGPEYVIAGEDIEAEFLLQNLGNHGRDIKLTTHNCALETEDKIFLEPNESRVLKVRATTPKDLHSLSRKVLKITATLKNDETVEVSAIRQVRIIPQSGKELIEVPQIPATFRINHLVRSSGQGVLSGFQGELFVSGTLDANDEHHIELKMKGPNGLDADDLGMYQEYYANYYNDKYNIFVGDKSFSSTALTELSRYGRGVEFRIQNEGAEIGGFYLKPRFFPDVSEELAGYVRFQFSDENKLAFNILHKQYTGERGEAIMGSLTSSFRIHKRTWMETEFSSGNLDKKSGSGFGLKVFSEPIKRMQLSSNILYASKYYPGYFTNTWNINTMVNFQASSKLNLSLHYSQDDRNASRDTLFGISPYSKLAQFSLNYRMMRKLTLRGQLRHNEMKDRMPGLKFHYLENTFRLQLAQQTKRVKLALAGEWGKKENFLKPPGEKVANALRTSFTANYQPSRRHSFQAMIQFYQFRTQSEIQDKQWIYGASLNSTLSVNTLLRLSYQSSFIIEEYYRNRSLLDLHLSQKLGKRRNHQITLSTNYILLQRTEDDRDFSIITHYTWRFGIRKGSRKSVQGLHGTIAKEGVRSVKGIVLYLNGRHAITDKNGNFSFNYVPPGNYMLTMDPTSIELHQVTTVPMPISVTIEPGVDALLAFGLTTGASINGKIDIERDPKTSRISGRTEARKLIMIEVSNGEETFRRIVDENYEFTFPDIRPGKWTVRVINQKEYEGYYFENKSWVFQLAPGTKENLNIRMLRKRKAVQFQNSLLPLKPVGN